MITNIKSSDLPQTKQPISIEIANRHISGLSGTYAEGKGLLALIGSSGYLEIALRGGNAGAFLEVGIGTEVRLKQEPGQS